VTGLQTCALPIYDRPTATAKSPEAVNEAGTISGNLLTGSEDKDADVALNALPTTTVVTGLIHKNAAGETVTTVDFSAGIDVYKAAGVKAGTITITASTGVYTFVGTADFNGTLVVQFTVGDGVTSSVATDLTLVLNEVNDDTVAVSDTISTEEGASPGAILHDFNAGDLSRWSNRYWDGSVWVTLAENEKHDPWRSRWFR